MSERSDGTVEQVALPCPACSPEFETAHEVLKEGGGWATVRCTECQHVHKEQLPEAKAVERQVVVSQSGESFTTMVEAPKGETIRRGEEFIVETDEGFFEVRITDLQVDAERRVGEATVEEVETIWTRAVGNVSVNVTLNPKDGRHDETRGITVYVPGDEEFVVGDEYEFGDETFSVKSVLLRDDATGYDFDQLDQRGDAALAKDVARVYGTDESSTAWSAW